MIMNNNIKKVCAWCDDKEDQDKKAKEEWFEVSHWLCKKCAKKYFN